ncbi:MAG: carbohydrate-binding protein, partial [Bacteroidetes bacterium]
KKIIFKLDTAIRSIVNQFGNTVWLKVERKLHNLSAYYSIDGTNWISVGASIGAVALDKVQPNYNSWVGTSVGVFAEGKQADFDFFVCKDAFSSLPAAGYSNYFGVEKINETAEKVVTNNSNNGGWFMISGADLGKDKRVSSHVELLASASTAGKIEIWLDDFKKGKLIATVQVTSIGVNNWKAFKAAVKNISGRHDVFVKFPAGSNHAIFIKSIRFIPAK